MSPQPISVLHIQGDSAHAEVIGKMLGEASTPGIHSVRVSTLLTGLDSVSQEPPDAVLLDISTCDVRGLEGIIRIQKSVPEIPLIVLTDCDDEKLGIEAVRGGAQDHLLKKGLTSGLLVRAIHYAIQRQRMLAEFRRYNRELQCSEQRIRTIITNSSEGLVVVDEQGRMRFVNPAAEALFRKPATELVGASFSLPLVPGKTTEADIPYGDSSKRSVEIRVVNIHWEGRMAHLVSLHDVTERRKLEEMKSEFLATVSHELRTPLSSIKNAVEILSKGRAGGVPPTQARFLAMVSRNSERLSGLIDELLDFSRLEAGKIGFRFSEIDVRQILRLMFATFQPQAESKNLIMKIKCPPTLPTVYADAVRIDQTLSNLISNALKFTPAGGKISLAVRRDGDQVELSVSDTGIGISLEHQDRIFERFYQVEDTLNRRSQGTGLGLCIARELVEAHAGEISLRSAVGKGTEFLIRLLSYSPRAVEAVELEMELRRQRDVGVISLVIVRLRPRARGESIRGAEEIPGSVYRRLEDHLRPVLRTADEVILQPASCRLVILLPKTAKAGAQVARKNIEEHLSPRVLPDRELPALELTILGPVSYPHDGATARDLLERASRMREIAGAAAH